ncbi:hypothetical protein ACTXT7_011157 [Hymenolepis weldensis]
MGVSPLECPICMEKLNNPVMLPCQHCFCWRCISACAQKINSSCPLCKKSFHEGETMRNLALEQILNHENPVNSTESKPSDPLFPKTFGLICSSEPQQQTQLQTKQDWGSPILAGAAGFLIGAVGVALGFKAASASKKRRG